MPTRTSTGEDGTPDGSTPRQVPIAKVAQSQVRSLPDYVQQHRPEGRPGGGKGNVLQNTEAKLIARILKKHGGNRTRAAEELGVHRVTLFRKMKRYGLS